MTSLVLSCALGFAFGWVTYSCGIRVRDWQFWALVLIFVVGANVHRFAA